MIYSANYRESSSCSNRAWRNASTLTNLETSAFYITQRGINKFSKTHQIIHVMLFCFVFLRGGVEQSPLLLRPLFGLLYQPRTMDDDERGAVGEMPYRGNRSTRRKLAPVPLCPPQTPHDLAQARIRAAAVRNQRLTSWTTARPPCDAHNFMSYCLSTKWSLPFILWWTIRAFPIPLYALKGLTRRRIEVRGFVRSSVVAY
jgi:hypothetical protein